MTQQRARPASLPPGIWALGFVSLFMDMSSEMIHSLLPVFLVTALGASPLLVGLIEGLGEAMTPIAKLLSGWASDRLGKRKPFVLIGYSLALLSKPLFALAPGAFWVLGARLTDRLGKGIRGAPRDALVAELAPASLHGAAYGLRQALDSVGALLGPLLALGLMALFADDFRKVFWAAAIPALACVAIIVLWVHEPKRRNEANAAPPAPVASRPGKLGAWFWAISLVGACVTLARFSEAFLILRAQDVGLPLTLAPLVLIVMNLIYAVSAYPLGALSDHIDRRLLMLCGFGVLILADLLLALESNVLGIMAGIALWGLHLGMTQGLLAALVAGATHADNRGLAFGVFNFIIGLTTLTASVLAGYLWQTAGPSITFLAGAGFTLMGSVGVLLAMFRPRPATP